MIRLKSLILESDQDVEVQNFRQELLKKYPELQDLYMYIAADKSLYISQLRAKVPGQGVGTKVMADIKAFADAHNLTTTLSPQADPRHKADLMRFYKNRGFIKNKGRHRDSSLGGIFGLTMYRRPGVDEDIDESSISLEELKDIANTAKKHAIFFLEEAGLKYPDYFTMKITSFKGEHAGHLALYKFGSIRSGKPIFWMNSDLPEMMKKWQTPAPIIRVLTENIVHEWWHAITDLLRIMKYSQQRTVKTPIPDTYGATEEEEAIEFAKWAFYGTPSNKESYFKSAIQEFNSFSIYD